MGAESDYPEARGTTEIAELSDLWHLDDSSRRWKCRFLRHGERLLLLRRRQFADQAGNFASSRLSCVARFNLSDRARAAFERFPSFLTRFRSSLRHA